MEGYVGNFIGGVLKEVRCHFNVGILEGSSDDNAVEWFFISVGDTDSICGDGLDIIFLLILDLGDFGNGMV